MRDANFARLERDYGIVLPGAVGFIQRDTNGGLAMDAQPQLFTTNNSGIPNYLTTYVDPDVIRAVYAPNKAVQIVGEETRKGDWTKIAAAFPVVESAGAVGSYGDYSTNGSSSANVNFVQRESYHYQTFCNWGDRELEMYAEASINYSNEVQMSAVLVLNKFQNLSYFFGIAGLQCYGLLNDPSLTAALTPVTKSAGGTGWALATPNEILVDYQKMVAGLIAQSAGLIDNDSELVLAGPPVTLSYLANANSFNVKARDLLLGATPKVRFETAVQYNANSNAGSSGINTLQLICPALEGRRTAICAFTEKLRTHRLIADTSSYKQKRSQGTWGTIIARPLAIAAMVGV